MKIRLLAPSEIDLFLTHQRIHLAESGRDGSVVFAPYHPKAPWQASSRSKDRVVERWSRSLDDPGWERVWGLIEEGRVVGDVTLRSRELASSLHRATLGMGVQLPFRGQGWGSRLIETALAWAREGDRLAWIDLNVFAHNERALALYRRFGFTERGRVEDCFRTGSGAITDVLIVLKL
jgi:ribosomal protein S18 acetylase RimI-like enzyme